jgi:hypothetical protein
MLKMNVRAVSMALAVLLGLQLPGSTPASATRHHSGSAYAPGASSSRFGFFKRHHRTPHARHGRGWSHRHAVRPWAARARHHLARHARHHLARHARHHHAQHATRRWAHHSHHSVQRLGHRGLGSHVHRASARLNPVATPAAQFGRPMELHPLLSVARRYVGHGRVTRLGGPWCRDFVNKVASQAGYRLRNKSRRAIDALALGHRVASPRPGDLVVMRHHVTIFAGYGGRGLIGLGGNQGRGGVSYSSFSPRRVLAYVRM